MLWWQAHEEGFLEQVDPLGVLELPAFCAGVLVAERNVELATAKAWLEGARRDLAEEDSKVATRKPKPGYRGGCRTNHRRCRSATASRPAPRELC